jgi:Skp family chaperone for outer membrane proteins
VEDIMKTRMAWFALPIAVIAWLAFQIPSSGAATPAIAYVSATRIMNETAEGRASLERVALLKRQRSADLLEKQQAFDAARKDLSTAKPEDRARLLGVEEQRRGEFQQTASKAEADIKSLQNQESIEVIAKVRGVVPDIVKGRDIQMVLNLETAVVWAAPSLDLTNEVIRRMNAGSTKPAPK